MTLGDPLEYLFGLERLGMKFGLENISKLSAQLDHPERSFRSVLVAGTNGKGSVTAMVERALRAAGHSTGRYTSPHLERIEERFVIDGSEVATSDLRESVSRVKNAVDALLARAMLETPPTFFEFCTATAFELFRHHGVSIAVLEVGLGGRLDATNVVTPTCAAITSIAFDHQAQLGHTLEAIAWEKAGVVKTAVPLVCGKLPPEADAVITRVCAERAAPLRHVEVSVRTLVHRPVSPPIVSFATSVRRLERVTLALDGRHQVDNAAVALCVLDTLDEAGIAVGDEAVRTGLEQTVWPGRMERVRWRDADVLLDAAHNAQGAQALGTHLDALGWHAVTLVFGVMRDKDAGCMLRILAPYCEQIVFTTPPTDRARPAADLASFLPTSGRVLRTIVIDDPEAALAHAVSSGARIVVAGSLFLIGALRGILR